MLTRKLSFEKPVARTLKQAFARPQPRLAEGLVLVKKGVENGMDISDGLLADLGHICQASHVGGVIEIERLPILPEVTSAFGGRSFEMALSGGEDYELLFTAERDVINSVEQASSCPISVIGEVIAESPGQVILIDREGKHTLPAKTGWDHFKRTSGKI
jgi:thiamine-monophosphate kinase